MLCLDKLCPSILIHRVWLNPIAPGVKEDEQAGFYSKHHPFNRQAHTNYYTQVNHSASCSSVGYLLTPHNNNSIQSKTEKMTMNVM